ncbi:alkaline ceramidase 1 [Tupaia chinensis]|uniref:alkaline ceramidase 1 n=1 Tax=Tupaia chinensis TaxID=246437 RepID=UPI000703DB4C|nr:alkaline ceramidase 1 [Tupaia chinensis]
MPQTCFQREDVAPPRVGLIVQRPERIRKFCAADLPNAAFSKHQTPYHTVFMPQFTCLVVVSAVISTFLSVVRPTLNAYGLYTVSVHIVYMVFQEYHKTSDRELRHFIEVSVVLWVLAVSCWVSDRFLCGFWQEINFFYLHSFWHVFISFTFPYLMVSMALVDARYEMPEQTLKVHYWPRDTWPLGVPYVELQGDRKSC